METLGATVTQLAGGRLSGLLLPLFSIRSRDDFGIGDFGSAVPLFAWMRSAKQRMWMSLPLLPTAPGDNSPYATRSAFGLNPLFIHLAWVEEFVEAGGVSTLTDGERQSLLAARASARVRYDLVRPLKESALKRAFERFEELHWKTGSKRARAFRAYREEMADWLDPFCLFVAISDDQSRQPWWEWPQPLCDRNPTALARERERLDKSIRFCAWLQWLSETQWQTVRQEARQAGVLLCGDEPFIIGKDSADAWANPSLLRRDARLGVPPDDFSATGQDWGLPYFDFDAMRATGFGWLNARAKRSADYYDLRRVDHAVGYFRQWIRDEKTPTGRFVPPEETQQRAYGEELLRLLSKPAGIVAEDLGVIPKFVRETLVRLGIPGYRVQRWERDGTKYRDPRQFPKVSLCTTGTHDTETLAEWWERASQAERDGAAQAFEELKGLPTSPAYTPQIHRALLANAESSGSDWCIVPWQDVIGSRARVNLPGSMNDENWSYRIERDAEDLLADPLIAKMTVQLAELTQSAQRG